MLELSDKPPLHHHLFYMHYPLSRRVQKPETTGRSRLNPVRGSNNTLAPLLTPHQGISTFGPKPEGVAKYLEPLITHAKDQIPPSLHRHTPIFLLATAGMRLLPEKEQNAVLGATCEYIFMHSKFSFDTSAGTPTEGAGRCGRSIRIISGEEEGLFGWIAVNYLMNGFAPTHTDHDRPTTFGFLDMGGASTQIAFEPSSSPGDAAEKGTPDENLADVRLRLLNGEEIRHRVFVTTWLGFGTNQARARYLKQAVGDWLKGHHHDRSMSNNARSLMTSHSKHSTISSIDIQDPCLPKNLQLHTTHHDPLSKDAFSQVTPVSIVGTGSFSQCLARTTPLLNKTAPCNRSPCLFNGVHVPPIDFSHHRFIGISEYWYSSQHVFGLGGAFDFEKYEKAAEQFCGRDWETIVEQHKLGATPNASSNTWGKDVDLSRLEMQCFKAAWIVNVLGQGMGIPRTSKGWKEAGVDGGDLKVDEKKAEELGLDDDKDKGAIPNAIFQSIDTIHGTAISWTLGKMVLEASKGIPAVGKASKPIGDPLGPAPGITPAADSYLDRLDRKLPSPLRRESLGFSAIFLLFYVIVLAVLLSFASRMKNHFRKSFRKWRRGSMKREKESFVNETGVASSDESSRPQSPVDSLNGGPATLGRFLSRLLPPSAASQSPSSTPRRTGTLTPSGSLSIATGRPMPKYSVSMPSPGSPSAWTASRLSDDPILVTEAPGVITPPGTSGLNPNGLTHLSLSRNSSQINLTRTLPTPRNLSGFSTPGPNSGFRSPSMYNDEA